jgi:hypothetical protein
LSTRGSSGGGFGAALVGFLAAATLPLAIYLTRFSDSYDLLQAGFAIPLAAILGFLAVGLARGSRRREALRLAPRHRSRLATAGLVLGGAGICMAVAAVVALGVYGLLDWWATRD